MMHGTGILRIKMDMKNKIRCEYNRRRVLINE